MPESAYSISERASTALGLTLSNPVELWEPTGCARPLYNILRLLSQPPTKYRRPSEGRRDSFGGGLLPAEGTPAHPMTRVLATSKAISRRYPLTGDCYRNGRYSVFRRMAARARRPLQKGAVETTGDPGSAPCLSFTVAVPPGRCFSQFDRNSGCFGGVPGRSGYEAKSKRHLGIETAEIKDRRGHPPKAACGTQTRHGGSVVKYQPCSQVLENEAFTGFLDQLARFFPFKGTEWFCHKFRDTKVV